MVFLNENQKESLLISAVSWIMAGIGIVARATQSIPTNSFQSDFIFALVYVGSSFGVVFLMICIFAGEDMNQILKQYKRTKND